MELNRILKITVAAPAIPVGSPITHVATSYQVSRIPDFSKPEFIIYQSLEDVTDLLVKKLPVELDSYNNLYVRTKYHYSGGRYDNWSNIIPLKGDQIGIKLSGTVIATPKVRYEINYDSSEDGHLIISTSDMLLYGGIGIHSSTTYIITNVDGKEIYKREKDVNNLTSIILDAKLIEPNIAYIVKVLHHTDTNATSNYGKAIIILSTDESSLFDITMPYELVPHKYTYFNLELRTTQYLLTDIIITDEYNNVVVSNLDQRTRTPRIYTGSLKNYYRYTVKARIKLLGGDYTSYRTVYSGIIRENSLIDFKYTLEYLNKFTMSQELMLGGLSTQVSRELYNGDILLTKNKDNSIYRYQMIEGKLIEIDKVLSLNDNLLDLPYLNVLPLYSGRVLVNYAIDKLDSVYRKSYFKLYEFNPITHKLVEINSRLMDKEKYGTANSSSMVVPNLTDVYYVPTEEVNVDGDNVNLTLKKLDLETFQVTTVSNLPFNVKYNVSLLALDDDRILIVGGSDEKITIDNNIKSFNRNNNDIYIYSIKENLFHLVGSISPEISNTLYNFHPVMRRDGMVVLFNAVETNASVGNQRTIIIDPKTFNITYSLNDYLDSVKYNTTIPLRNGDILRISNREIDPQKVYTYVSNTYREDQLIENDVINNISDLVVPAGQVVTIESPYRYNSITVQGTDYNNTGLLQWLDGDLMREFRFRDRIITRDTTDNRNLYLPIVDYDSITILEDVSYTVNNFIHIPESQTLTLQQPFTAEYIIIEEGASFIVE